MNLAERLAGLPPAERRHFIATLDPAHRQDLLERVARETARARDPLAGLDPYEWLSLIRPAAFDQGQGAAPPAWFQREAVNHIWQINDGPAQPLVMAFFRGGAKSTIAETIPVRLGALGLRRYCLYISDSQDQADDHVDEVAKLLESKVMERYYPAMADRKVGKFSSSKGWRRNRLRTKSGVIVDALGLDTARSRGAKLDDTRPDMLILDDVDNEADSQVVVTRKLRALANKIMPAVTDNCAIVVAQNLIHQGSIVNQIVTGKTDLLTGSKVIGPVKAIRGLQTELDNGRRVIVDGQPEWEGYDLDRAQRAMARTGYAAFLTEVQQEIDERPGALLTRADIDQYRVAKAPADLDDVIVCVDPNKTGRSDDAGVVVVGVAERPDSTGHPVRHLFVLADDSGMATPSEWRDTAVRAAINHRAGMFVVEHAGLGEHAELTLKGSPLWTDDRSWPIRDADVSMGKKDRARPVAQLYKDGRIHHVGDHPYLERQWTSWEPDIDPMSPGAVDAMVHGATRLLLGRSGRVRARRL